MILIQNQKPDDKSRSLSASHPFLNRTHATRRWFAKLLGFTTLCLFAIAASGATPVVAPPGLVGWWPGDGNALDMAGTNNGILQGGATATNAGYNGSAFKFDGTNAYVQIPNAPELNPTNLTIECWVNYSSLDAPGNTGNIGTQYMVFKQNSHSGTFEGYNLGKHRYAYDLFVWEVSSATSNFVQLNSLTAIVTNQWYYVVGVRGSNYVQLYINGQLENQTNVTFPQDYGSLPLYFGTSGQSYWDRKLAGMLDEVSLYNRPLSSNEIAALYAAGVAGKYKSPTILSNATGQTKYWGDSVAFSNLLTGFQPMSYRWFQDSNQISGATNPSLLLTNLQMTNAGAYSVIITNFAGAVTNTPAQLNMIFADFSWGQAGSPPGAMKLNIGGLTGQTYGIQGTTNLSNPVQWRGLANIILTNSSQGWIDSNQMTLPQFYYRIVPGPISVP